MVVEVVLRPEMTSGTQEEFVEDIVALTWTKLS